MSEFSKFKKEFQAAIDKSLKASEKSIRAAAIQTLSGIIYDTPVGNPTYWKNPPPKGYSGGSLRGNWQTTLNNPANGIVNTKQTGNSGASSQKLVSSTSGYKTTDTIYFTNNLPYAVRINEGYSVQPGAEMKFVEKNISKFNRILEQIVRKNKI